jgi:hypothetical protein
MKFNWRTLTRQDAWIILFVDTQLSLDQSWGHTQGGSGMEDP